MKIAYLGVNSNLADTTKQEDIIQYLKFNILRVGEQVSLISYFNNNYQSLLKYTQDDFDLVFIIGTDNAIYNHNIKENVSKILGKKLYRNLDIENTLKFFCEKNSIVFASQEELVSLIPESSIPIFSKDNYSI